MTADDQVRAARKVADDAAAEVLAGLAVGRIARVLAKNPLLPHEDWCCAMGCTRSAGCETYGCPGCQCVSGMADRALVERFPALLTALLNPPP